jgi:hypothetical protein
MNVISKKFISKKDTPSCASKVFIESKTDKRSNEWIATVLIESDESYSNEQRLKALSQIIDSIEKKTEHSGVILFPAGWFYEEGKKTKTLYEWVAKNVVKILQSKQRDLLIILGVDGRLSENEIGIDQIAVAISKKGIEGLARKFHPTVEERDIIACARNYLSTEEGKSRIVTFCGRKFYLCVCYDIFGINHLELENPKIDFALGLVHQFYLKGEGPSGEVYFARNGFAGASKQWKCPVFGSVVFFRRNVPQLWPSGVMWNQGNKPTINWKYEDNPLRSKDEFQSEIREGRAVIRIYSL